MIKDRFFLVNLHESFDSYSKEGKLIWSSDIPRGFIVNKIFFDPKSNELCCFAGVDNNSYMENHIINIDFSSGKVNNTLLLNKEVVSVTLSTEDSHLICSDGFIIDHQTGAVLYQFDKA